MSEAIERHPTPWSICVVEDYVAVYDANDELVLGEQTDPDPAVAKFLVELVNSSRSRNRPDPLTRAVELLRRTQIILPKRARVRSDVDVFLRSVEGTR